MAGSGFGGGVGALQPLAGDAEFSGALSTGGLQARGGSGCSSLKRREEANVSTSQRIEVMPAVMRAVVTRLAVRME